MNQTFKKIEDLANYVHKQADEHRMPTLIIASPDIQNDEGTTLCSLTGMGADIVLMLASAFLENDYPLGLTKDAIAFVEGGKVMGKLARARNERRTEKDGCEEKCEGDCTEACARANSTYQN